MTTTVRSVRVELEMGIAGYVRDAKTAGRETDAAFDRVEKRLGSTNRSFGQVEISMRKTSTAEKLITESTARMNIPLAQTERNLGRNSKALDTFSGRAGIAVAIAASLGSSLIPIAAVGVPALAGLATQGGFAAAALGATVLAARGVGDSLKAIEKARLTGTAQDLEAAREAVSRLAPEAQDLVHHLEDLRDVGRSLQFTAARGILGGADDALTSLETRIPQVQRILTIVSDTAGDAIRRGGAALASSDYDDFFRFLKREAGPELDATADSIGHVAHGLAELFAGTVPLQRDFSSFLRGSTESFDEWATRLGDSREFSEFVNYVETEGPKVEETAGSIANAIIQIVEAAAPLGGPTLQIVGSLADLLARIADSPIGTPVFGALAAYSAYSKIFPVLQRGYNGAAGAQTRFENGLAKGPALATRAAGGLRSVASDVAVVGSTYATAGARSQRETDRLVASSTRLKSTFGGLAKGAAVVGGLALATSGAADKIGLSNTASLALLGTLGGPWGTVLGAATGAALDFKAANDDVEDAVDRANQAIESGNYKDQAAALKDLQEKQAAADRQRKESVREQLFDGETYKRFAGIVTGANHRAADAQAELTDAMSNTRGLANLLAPAIGKTGRELYDAAGDARQFSGALADVNGWLDKRDAVRNYRDSIHDLGKALHNGFQPKDAETIDAVGRTITQVASDIKDKALRTDFLAGARASLVDLANSKGPKAKAAVLDLVDALDRYKVTTPPIKHFDVDTSKIPSKVNAVDYLLRELAGKPWKADLTVDGSQALLTAQQVAAALGQIHDRKVTITTVHVDGHAASTVEPHASIPKAAGGTVPGQRTPYGDKVLIAAAPGEELITNRHGEADAFRADRAAGRIPGYADGGYVQPRKTTADLIASTYTTRSRAGASDAAAAADGRHAHAADGAAKALHKLETAADKVQKSYEKEKSKLDALISQRDAIASSVSSAALHDPFGNGLAGLDAQVDADTNDIDAMAAALSTLVKNGLDPKSALYQQLAASFDLNTAQQLAQLSSTALAGEASRFQHRADEASALGLAVAGSAGAGNGKDFTEAIRGETQASRELQAELYRLGNRIDDLKDLPKHTGDAVYTAAKQGTKEGAHDGTFEAGEGRKRRTSTSVRTGGGSR